MSGALEVSEGGRSGGGTVLRGLCFSVGSPFWGPVVEALKLGSGHLSRKRRRQQLGLRELRERPNCGSGGGNPEDADGRAAQCGVPVTCEDVVAHDDRPSGGRAPAGRLDTGGRTGELPAPRDPKSLPWVGGALSAWLLLRTRETPATSRSLRSSLKCFVFFFFF